MKVRLNGTTTSKVVIPFKEYLVDDYSHKDDSFICDAAWIEGEDGFNYMILLDGKNHICAFAETGYWEIVE